MLHYLYMKNEMSAYDYIGYSWGFIKNKLGKLYSIIIPLFAVSIINSVLTSASHNNGLVSLVGFLFSYYVSMVAVKALISLVRTGDFSWGESLLSLNQALRVLGIFLLSVVVFGALFGVMFVMGGMFGVGALLLKQSGTTIAALIGLVGIMILVVSYFAMRLQFAYYLVVDYAEIGIFDALKLAWVKTTGKFWYMCAVYLWGTLVMILGMLAFFIGLIVALPMLYVMITKLYTELFDETVAPAQDAVLVPEVEEAASLGATEENKDSQTNG